MNKDRLKNATTGRLHFARQIYRAIRQSLMPLATWRLKLKHVGHGTYIDPSVHVLGWRSVRVGRNSMLSEDCWINVNHRDKDDASLLIGDHCFIGRRNFFSPAKLIEVSHFALIGADCRFLGSNHIYEDPFKPYITTGTTDSGTIRIGANCWIGANCTFVGAINVGHGSVIGAGTVVNRDIPPFSVAIGNPCRVVKRFNAVEKTWVSTGQFNEDLEKFLPNEEDYMSTLLSSADDIRMPIPAAGRSRGDLT